MSTPVTPTRRPLTLGPGTLTLGTTGSSLDMSMQITAISVEWDVDEGDNFVTLGGLIIPGDRTYSAKLTGTVAADLDTDGVIDWTWKNRGTEVPFSFVPDNSRVTAKVAGNVTIDPINLGGEVGKRATADFEWACATLPTFTPATVAGTTPASGAA